MNVNFTKWRSASQYYGWSYNDSGDIRGHVTTSEAIYDMPPASEASDHDYDDCFPELDMEGANESEL